MGIGAAVVVLIDYAGCSDDIDMCSTPELDRIAEGGVSGQLVLRDSDHGSLVQQVTRGLSRCFCHESLDPWSISAQTRKVVRGKVGPNSQLLLSSGMTIPELPLGMVTRVFCNEDVMKSVALETVEGGECTEGRKPEVVFVLAPCPSAISWTEDFLSSIKRKDVLTIVVAMDDSVRSSNEEHTRDRPLFPGHQQSWMSSSDQLLEGVRYVAVTNLIPSS